MKRQDIEVGVEYAETAPLAYGREPNSPTHKVRITDKQPGPWYLREVHRYTEGTGALGGRSWTTVQAEPVHERDLPDDAKPFGGALRDAPFGKGTIPLDSELVSYRTEKGGLPGERYDVLLRVWRVALIVPAAIHRTWATVEADTAERRERERHLDDQSKVNDINAFLRSVGLSDLMQCERLGTGIRVSVGTYGGGKDGERLLADLEQWAETHKVSRRRRKEATS